MLVGRPLPKSSGDLEAMSLLRLWWRCDRPVRIGAEGVINEKDPSTVR
jgi:hypothetical protein